MVETQTATGEQTPSRTKQEVINEAFRIEESVLHSSRAHFAAARLWNNFHLWLGIPIVIMSTVAGASFLGKFESGQTLAGILTLIVAVASAVLTFLNPSEKVTVHQAAGNEYDALWNEVRIFRLIDCWDDGSKDSVLTDKLKTFSQRKNDLNAKCPAIPDWAYRHGKASIERGEASFRVDSQKDPKPSGTPPPSNAAVPPKQ